MQETNNQPVKKLYQTPALKIFGDVSSLTKGSLLGEFTDKDFPANTPKPDLRFS